MTTIEFTFWVIIMSSHYNFVVSQMVWSVQLASHTITRNEETGIVVDHITIISLICAMGVVPLGISSSMHVVY